MGQLHVQLRERVQKGPAGDPFVAKARIYMALVDNPGTLPDPTPDAPDPDDFNNPTNRPGRQVSHRAACSFQARSKAVLACYGSFRDSIYFCLP